MKKIWLVTVGEPSHIDNGLRLHRTGLLASSLSKKGFQITFFNSTFSHQEKRQRFKKSKIIEYSENLNLGFMYGRPYKKNVSFNRVLSNKDNSLEFRKMTLTTSKPDLIICAFPILGLIKEVARYADKNKIPWIIDIRDFWPDVFLEILPKYLIPLARLFFLKFLNDLKSSLIKADAIISPFDGTKEWLNNQYKKIQFLEKYQTIPFTYPRPKKGANVNQNIRDIIDESSNCVITFAGNISDFSNIEHLFAIEKCANKRDLNIQIIVCGSGPKFEYLLSKAKSIKSSIKFTGLLEKESLSYILSKSDYGFLGYDAQHLVRGVPNKVIEYTCHSLPIVINKAMEISDNSKYDQILVPYSLEDLDTLLIKINSKEYRNTKANIKEFYEKNFSDDVITKKYSALIKNYLTL